MSLPHTLSGLAAHEVSAARDAAISEALEWRGARFQQGASIKPRPPIPGYSDCGHFIKAAWEKAGVKVPADFDQLPVGWHLHKDDERYLRFILSFCHEVAQPEPADLATFLIGRSVGHIGMLTIPPQPGMIDFTMIHCLERFTVMTETVTRRTLNRWRAREVRFFSPW